MTAKSVPANVDQIRTMELHGTLIENPIFKAQFINLSDSGWQIFAVDQVRGRCYYPPRKWITIPVWCLRESTNKTKPGFWIWYVAHEFAHAHAGFSAHHGPLFMHWLKLICPTPYQHWELEYKPENASMAGISKSDRGMEISQIKKLEDLL